MNQKVLILGSKGTLGQALVSEFKGNNYDVVAWDRENVDATSQELEPKILSINPKIIINSIAYNGVDKMETDEEFKKLGFLLNSTVPQKLAEISKKIDAVFVHYSTSYIFDGENKDGYKENDKPSPLDKYGESKLEGEKAVEKVDGKYYIIRLARLFGIKGASEMSKRTFVDIMMAEIEKKELEVGNTEVSSLTYAPDLAKLTKYIIEEKVPYGIYHGANYGQCTWYEWAREIFEILGRGPKVIPASVSLTPKTTKHPVYSGLINTKLPLQRSWQEALKDFLKK
ncbi:MAG TPA: NAD(P)-dependent oxidoreductase [Patescibacteria group bacterium]|nr:NAD(P)-dependent oxidoreductase [Patescibacteria group bacterium]